MFEPGWRWSQHVKPIAGTDSRQTAHLGYVLSGRMHIVMDDGSEGECGPGEAVYIAPGHDAWTVGDQACVMVDFGQIASYAKPRHRRVHTCQEGKRWHGWLCRFSISARSIAISSRR